MKTICERVWKIAFDRDSQANLTLSERDFKRFKRILSAKRWNNVKPTGVSEFCEIVYDINKKKLKEIKPICIYSGKLDKISFVWTYNKVNKEHWLKFGDSPMEFDITLSEKDVKKLVRGLKKR